MLKLISHKLNLTKANLHFDLLIVCHKVYLLIQLDVIETH